jgi:Uncharacterised protein family (UPF0158)
MSRWDDDALRTLGGAVYRGDGSVVVELVRGRLTDDVLQLAGDGLLVARAGGVEGVAELAAECAAKLRERWWEGDEELADQLEAALGKAPTPMLRPLALDLEELAGFLEGGPTYGGGRIDLKTGDLWPCSGEFDDIDEDDDHDEDRWLYVERLGSNDGYRDMELFIATVDNSDIADRLEIAISGRGAFRRFKDVLSRWPEEFKRYYQLSSERQRGRARAWLAAKGYCPRVGN